MALTQRQIKAATATSALSVTATLTSMAVAGNLLVAVWETVANPGTVTAPAGWSVAWTHASGTWARCLYKISNGSETAVVFSTSNSVTQDLFVWEYQGWVGTPTLDQIATNAPANGTSTSTGTTGTTIDANELAIAGIGLSGSGGSTVTPWTNSFVDETGRPSTRLFIGTKILSSIGTVESTYTWTATRGSRAGVATFRDAATSTFRPKVIIF